MGESDTDCGRDVPRLEFALVTSSNEECAFVVFVVDVVAIVLTGVEEANVESEESQEPVRLFRVI